jgi:hypothetical protein
MIGRITFLSLALSALFALQFADCLSPLSADQQTMDCCGSMPCNPANRSHNCCETMVTSGSPSMVCAAHPVLNVPVVAVMNRVQPAVVRIVTEALVATFVPSQHSPPDLYTLHSSLLI